MPEPTLASATKRMRPVLFSDAGRKAVRTIGLIIVLLSVFVTTGSFLILTGASDIEPTPEVWTIIWLVNGLLVPLQPRGLGFSGLPPITLSGQLGTHLCQLSLQGFQGLVVLIPTNLQGAVLRCGQAQCIEFGLLGLMGLPG